MVQVQEDGIQAGDEDVDDVDNNGHYESFLFVEVSLSQSIEMGFHTPKRKLLLYICLEGE